MKADIHPSYHQVKVILPDGREHMIWSAYPKDELHVDVVWDKHPAWTRSDSIQVSQINEKVVQFKNRYGSLNIFGEGEGENNEDK